MAVETRVWRDRCKARIDEDRSSLKPTCGPMRHAPPIDFYHDCRIALDTWLTIPLAEPAKPKGRTAARTVASSPA